MSFQAIVLAPRYNDSLTTCFCPFVADLDSSNPSHNSFTIPTLFVPLTLPTLPTAFDLVLLLSLANLITWTRLTTRAESSRAAHLALQTQQVVKATVAILILHTVKSIWCHSSWSTGSSLPLPIKNLYTVAVCAIALLTTNSVAALWPEPLVLDPKAFPCGRPVEFYEFGVEDAKVLPPYVVMHLRARGLKTEQWGLVA